MAVFSLAGTATLTHAGGAEVLVSGLSGDAVVMRLGPAGAMMWMKVLHGP